MGQKMISVRARLTVEQLGRKHTQIHSFPDCVVVFLRQVIFLRKLFEDVLKIKPVVLLYFLPILNFSCHFRFALPEGLEDGRGSRDVGSQIWP